MRKHTEKKRNEQIIGKNRNRREWRPQGFHLKNKEGFSVNVSKKTTKLPNGMEDIGNGVLRSKINNTNNNYTKRAQKEEAAVTPRQGKSSSYKEHKVNALASGADEGRDKLRKAAVSCK